MHIELSRFKKRVLGVVIGLATSGAVWAACGGTEGLVVQSVGELSSGVIEKLAEMTKDIMKADYEETNAILDGISIVTKQVRMSGEVVATTTAKATEARAGAQTKILNRELADEVITNYRSMGAQDPCATIPNGKRLYEAETVARTNAVARTRAEVDVGKYADPLTTMRAREDLHRDLFCTQSDVDAGLCSKIGKIPGGDQNAAMLWSTDASAEATKARNALINNLLGTPDAPVPKVMAGTAEAGAYMLEKRRKDAVMGLAAWSLKSIQVENETYKPVLDARVGDYFGTDRATRWATNQATQAQRGLMIDGVKIQGLNLKVAQLRLEQQLSTEMLLSALTEQENQRVNKPDVAKAQAVLATEAARAKVSK